MQRFDLIIIFNLLYMQVISNLLICLVAFYFHFPYSKRNHSNVFNAYLSVNIFVKYVFLFYLQVFY